MMTDTVSGYFLALIGHATIIFTAYFNQDEYLFSALPKSVTEIPEVFRVQFVVILTLTIICCLLEFLFILRSMPSYSLSVTSSSFHTIACLFLLKFIVDVHPYNHFLILFLVLSLPPIIVHVLILAKSFRFNRLCLQ